MDVKMNYYLLIVSAILMGCSGNMIEFKPVKKNGDSYVVMESNKDSLFVQGLEKVLTFYDVNYEKKEGNSILIDANLYSDKDLMYNYTKKAEDPEWQETHE